MKNLFDAERMAELKGRVTNLQPSALRQWGKMDPAQALAHLSIALESASGDRAQKRMLMGYVLGGLVKRKVVSDDAPMIRNAPTAPDFVCSHAEDFTAQQQRLLALLTRIEQGGPAVMTSGPHPFFGVMTPMEWAILQYKHVDHHLRQFGA